MSTATKATTNEPTRPAGVKKLTPAPARHVRGEAEAAARTVLASIKRPAGRNGEYAVCSQQWIRLRSTRAHGCRCGTHADQHLQRAVPAPPAKSSFASMTEGTGLSADAQPAPRRRVHSVEAGASSAATAQQQCAFMARHAGVRHIVCSCTSLHCALVLWMVQRYQSAVQNWYRWQRACESV